MARVFAAGRLWATTSALALTAITGGAALACNPSIILNGPGSVAGVTNAGDLGCVVVGDQAVVNGDITNEPGGKIGTGALPPQTGIAVNNATINGAIVNSGVINAAGAAIKVTGSSTVTGGIRNGSDGTIEARGDDGDAKGVSVSGANFAGGITNSGTIIVTGRGRAVGISVGGRSGSNDQHSEPQQ
jgi:hypothetical protein